jgi:hypothetical protein
METSSLKRLRTRFNYCSEGIMPLSKYLAVPLLLLTLAAPAWAQEHHRGRGEARERWQGDIRRFHDHDIARWRQGHWVSGVHGGRRGWWWIVGPTWYWYPAPVYPYPDPYQPPLAVVPALPEPFPPGAAGVAPQAPTGYWYYCRDSGRYYPYVAQCRSPWHQVPARP